VGGGGKDLGGRRAKDVGGVRLQIIAENKGVVPLCLSIGEEAGRGTGLCDRGSNDTGKANCRSTIGEPLKRGKVFTGARGKRHN